MAPLLPLLTLLCAQEDSPRTLTQQLAEGDQVKVDGVLFILNDQVITDSEVAIETTRRLRVNPRLSGMEASSRALSERVFDLIAREGFRRLSLDMSLLDEQITERIQGLIEESGSRARFEEELRADGYAMDSFRHAMESQLIQVTWRGILTGDQPSPLEGFRNRIAVSPSEIREAFEKDPERWKQGNELVWRTFQFFDDESGAGVQRASEVAEALSSGKLTAEEASQRANHAPRPESGDPSRKSLRADLKEFLLRSEPGAVSEVDPIPGLGAQIVLLIAKSPAREIGFEEAQDQIVAELRDGQRERLVTDAMAALVRSSYSWFPPELAEFMGGVPGLNRPAGGEQEF
jgi:hypothetical protein